MMKSRSEPVMDDAEITRLRTLVEELKADRIRINDEAETEIKRLREALRSVIDACSIAGVVAIQALKEK